MRRAWPAARAGARLRAVGASALALLAVACLGGRLLPSSDATTRVESIPSGAEVFAMGERLGTTPLDVSDARVYPVHYPRALAPLYGKLVLRHPGCDELVQDLTLRTANEGVVAQLACAERAGEHRAASADAGPPASARERLAEIESLRREGLLSEDEERAIRDRVLREQLEERPPAEALRLLEALRGAGALDEAEYRARRAEILDRF